MIVPSLAAALLSATLPATPCARPAPPVVLVTGGDRFGAGIVWNGDEGLVLTALHVVELMPEIRVSLAGGREQRATIVDRDPGLDLALLRADGALRVQAALAARPGPPRCGDRVRLHGFPGRRAAAAEGTVVAGARRFAGATYVEIAGRAEPGASGGPVVDADGAIVGVVDLVLADRGTTLAIPIDLARARFPAPDRSSGRRAAPLARAEGGGRAVRSPRAD